MMEQWFFERIFKFGMLTAIITVGENASYDYYCRDRYSNKV